MKLILYNDSSDNFSYLAGTAIVPAGSSLDLDSSLWFSLWTDPTFLKDMRINNILVGDGTTQLDGSATRLSMPESETYVEYVNSFNFNNKDIDGALIVRSKAAKKGWSFLALAPEITTSTLLGSLYCKDSAGNNISGLSCKIYDGNGAEITTGGLANINLTTCEKTVLDIELPYDYELIGGALRIHANPAQDLRLWIIGAPDIPAIYGGSKEFASGINLKFLAPDSSFEIDGRVTKYITYSAITHSGKIRIILKHAAGLTVNMQIVMHTYRL